MRERSAVGIIVLLLIFGAFYLFFTFRTPSETPLTTNSDTPMSELTLASEVFLDKETIPLQYTCDGADVSPPLMVSGIPEGAVSLTLIMDDPDAPVGTWDHWVIFNMPPTLTEIGEGIEPEGTPGNNSWGRTGYGGPCPPDGEHRYFFKLFALDITLDLSQGASKEDVLSAMEGHTLGEAELMGRYTRKK